jgi:hypothetical protein
MNLLKKNHMNIFTKEIQRKYNIKKKKKQPFVFYLLKECREPELNWRHEELQSTALPTELSRRNVFIIIRTDYNCIICSMSMKN